MDKKQLEIGFKKIFEIEADALYFAPGRINLIGEHTDYNGGHVFPCAISLGTYAAVTKRNDNKIRLFSANFPDQGIIQFALNDLAYNKAHNWANYPKGMITYFQKHGQNIDTGFDAYIEGNLPNASGLSSSASIEMLFGEIFRDLFSLSIDQFEIVKIGMEVENNFMGVNSGIMDQFAVGMGKKDQAILLDTNTLDYELVPIQLGKYVIVIMNTNKRRELADSKYNERRSECETALSELQSKLDITSLGDLDKEQFDENMYLIDSDTLLRRARHAVFENQRTLIAEKALTSNDLVTFGKLMNASHVSLQFDYEVTGIELDTLARTAWQQPGVLGARMTGAGFGGCAIALVEKEQVDHFIEVVGDTYETKIGHAASFYIAEIADGPKKIAK